MTKQLSHAAQVAKIIRTDLKKLFPSSKFKVLKGSNSVSIYWFDGPTEEEVNRHFIIYKSGSFDMSQDMYTYDNLRNDIPQVQYLSFDRDISESVLQQAFDGTKNYDDILDGCNSLDSSINRSHPYNRVREYIRYYIRKMNLENGFNMEIYKKL